MFDDQQLTKLIATVKSLYTAFISVAHQLLYTYVHMYIVMMHFLSVCMGPEGVTCDLKAIGTECKES